MRFLSHKETGLPWKGQSCIISCKKKNPVNFGNFLWLYSNMLKYNQLRVYKSKQNALFFRGYFYWLNNIQTSQLNVLSKPHQITTVTVKTITPKCFVVHTLWLLFVHYFWNPGNYLDIVHVQHKTIIKKQHCKTYLINVMVSFLKGMSYCPIYLLF